MLAPLHLGVLEELHAQEEDERRHLLNVSHRLVANGRHACRADGADDVEERVSAVQLGGVPAANRKTPSATDQTQRPGAAQR